MKSYYSDVFHFRGTHYDFGYLQGQQLKNSPILPNRERQWRPREKRHFIVDPETSMNMLRQLALKYWMRFRDLLMHWNSI